MSERAAPPTTPTHVRELPRGRVLAFAPHPDDEVAGPGGVLCLHRRRGDAVRVVVATDGVAGDPDGRFDKASYTERRRGESRAGLRELGVDDVTFWGFPDSCVLVASDIELGVQHATAALQAMRPDHVYLPWEHEGHPDHHALHTIVVQAMARADYRGSAWGYEVWHAMVPDLVVDISDAIEQKKRAMLAHTSQLAYVAYDHCVLGLNAYRSLFHARGRGYWEAFRVVQ